MCHILLSTVRFSPCLNSLYCYPFLTFNILLLTLPTYVKLRCDLDLERFGYNVIKLRTKFVQNWTFRGRINSDSKIKNLGSDITLGFHYRVNFNICNATTSADTHTYRIYAKLKNSWLTHSNYKYWKFWGHPPSWIWAKWISTIVRPPGTHKRKFQ